MAEKKTDERIIAPAGERYVGSAETVRSSVTHVPDAPLLNPVEPAQAEQFRIHYVRITNGLDVPFTDRHDGVPVTIEPGKSENLPLDMAAHFFGYSYGVKPETMFRHVCKRQGWNTPEFVKQNPDTHKTLAQEYFDKLKIESITYKMVEEKPDLESPIPADPQIGPDELPSPLLGRAKSSQQPQL
jgi:hypothetical protein